MQNEHQASSVREVNTTMQAPEAPVDASFGEYSIIGCHMSDRGASVSNNVASHITVQRVRLTFVSQVMHHVRSYEPSYALTFPDGVRYQTHLVTASVSLSPGLFIVTDPDPVQRSRRECIRTRLT